MTTKNHPVFDKLETVLKGSGKICSFFAVIPLFLIMIIAVLDVIGGKVFGKSMSSSTELIQYMNVPLVCLAMCYVEYQNGHTRIQVLTKHYPKILQKILYALGSLVGCVVCGYIAIHACGMLVDYMQRNTPIQSSSPIPVWPFILMMIVGYLLTGVSFVWSGLRVFLRSDEAEDVEKVPDETENLLK